MQFGSAGMGGELHVSRTTVVMLVMTVFNELQASCHCSYVKWLFFNRCIRSSTWLELLSKNLMWKFSIFSFGMGLNILGGALEAISGTLAINVFGRICSYMGR